MNRRSVRAGSVAALVLLIIAIPLPAAATDCGAIVCTPDANGTSTQTGPNDASVGADAADGQVKTTTTAGNGRTTTTTRSAASVVVPPPCQYEKGLSGKELAAMAQDSTALAAAQATGHVVTFPADVLAHANDDGYWYGMVCSSDTFGDNFAAFQKYIDDWLAQNKGQQDTWVAAGDRVPTVPIPPEILEAIAWDTMKKNLVAPEMHFNPAARTFVNLLTWMWVDPDSWTPISVTASAGGNSVTVTATPDALSVAGLPDGSTAITACANGGRPYTKGAVDSDTDCAIRFSESSGGQPGQQWSFTTTLTWKVTVTGAPRIGPDILTTGSDHALIVAEVQTVNTH